LKGFFAADMAISGFHSHEIRGEQQLEKNNNMERVQ
jgi:hypothetical protein